MSSASSVSVGGGGGSIYTPLTEQTLFYRGPLPRESSSWWGMTPAQEAAWDAYKACERPFMALGSLDYTGRITYSGLEFELPNFERCMAERGFGTPWSPSPPGNQFGSRP